MKLRVPKEPYIKEAPNKNSPDEKEPKIKYFKPLSTE
jgi:hypothetical protein